MMNKTDDDLCALPAFAARGQDLPSTARIAVICADREGDTPELRTVESPTPHYLEFLRLFR